MTIKRLQIERVYPFAIDYPFFTIYIRPTGLRRRASTFSSCFVRPSAPRTITRRGQGEERKRGREREEAEEEAGAEEEQKKRKKREERVNVLATPCFKDCKRLLMPHRGWPVTRRSLSLFSSLVPRLVSSYNSPKYPCNKTEWHNHGRNRTNRIGRYGRLSDAFLN